MATTSGYHAMNDDSTLPDHGPPASLAAEQRGAASKPRSSKKLFWLGVKIAVSVGGLYLVYGDAIGRDGMAELTTRLSALRWEWFVAAMGMQLTAICFAVVRWRLLLGGQGIRARWSFLFPSFMIGRFWGAFTPGGLGLDGWRLYDVAKQSEKPARAVAVTATEKILGQLAFGLVVMGGSVWGLQMMGVEGLVMINAFFVVLVSVGLTFLARPRLFIPLFKLAPKQIRPRLTTLIDAVSAYQGKLKLLATAVGCGVAVHSFNNLIYVCAAQAMRLELTPTVVFFASSIVIMSTIVPLSLNGVGLREATAAKVLEAFGVAEPIAAATYTLGWLAEMCVSAIGVPILLWRRNNYDAKLVVEDASREDEIYEAIGEVEPSRWPEPRRGMSVGLGAGLVGGMLVGFGEAVCIVADGGGRTGHFVLGYGALVYGIACGLGGATAGWASAWIGRKMQREAVPEPEAYARFAAVIVALFAFALGAFRIRRDVFHEEIAFKSLEFLGVAAGCAAGAALLYVAVWIALRSFTRAKSGRLLLRAWGTPVLFGGIVAVALGVGLSIGPPSSAAQNGAAARAEDAPNVLVIVVDTLRADHLPAYGYQSGSTPELDRFAEDAIRYEQAFANASWTRPSFASIMSGRFASSHSVMAKSDSLPDDVETLAESMSRGGYATAGFVTNFNVEPHYNFQQGFDTYEFLEPEFVLGADSASSKLLLVQSLRRVIRRVTSMAGGAQPGGDYQDAETVNRRIGAWLNDAPTESPWFLFTAYMDPHDPYFVHPYDGEGYSRAAHQHPELEEADRLRTLYDGEITYWDEQFGALMDELRQRGLYDDMMIVVTSDHGEEFADHGGFWHGTTLYDEQVHVPLFVKLPGNERAGTRVGHWVQSVDLMPTILRRVGLEIPRGVQGGDLNEGTTRVFAEESHEGNILGSLRELRDFEELKIIVANDGNPRGLAPVELYRVADDPGETENIADAERERADALTQMLDEARRAAAEGAVEGVEVHNGEDELERQCALGYMDSEACCRRGLLPASQCE